MNTATWTRFWDRDSSQTISLEKVIEEKKNARYPFTVVSPKVILWAKNHYKCPDLVGVPLENSGGSGTAGAHWDKLIVGNDMMNPSDFFNTVNSGLNFALMEDYGHFSANYSMEEHLSWGLDAGCDAFSEDCSKVPMTCPKESQEMCSPDYYSMGNCTKDPLAESCNVFYEYVFSDCRHSVNKEILIQTKLASLSLMYFGPNGRCLMGKISSDQKEERGLCLKVDCQSSSLVVITVQLENGGEKNIECTGNDKDVHKDIVSDGSQYLICPNVAEMCREELNCPKDCNGNGRCLKSGKCWCYVGFEGEDCSATVDEYYPFVFAHGNSIGVLLVGLFFGFVIV